MLSNEDLKQVNQFTSSYSFYVSDKNTVNLLKNKKKVALKVGETYGCKILNKSENKLYEYEVFLTNMEFRKVSGTRRLFSVSVDLFLDNKLFKSDVYFYNLAFIKHRTTRFPIRPDTISNNYAFWTTLQPREFKTHHSDIQFYRMALENGTRGKECRANLRKTRKNHASTFTKLDEIKNKISLPKICFKVEDVESSSSKVVHVYGISKNAPMKKLAELKVGDKIKDDETIQMIDSMKMIVRHRDDDTVYAQMFDYNSNSSHFWRKIDSIKQFFDMD